MSQQTKQGTHPTFFVLILVFFFWGFVAASNSILIPFCKKHFDLTQIQSQLVDFAFYGAYFVGSLILYLLSALKGVDILNRIGFKKGIIYGLLLSGVGSAITIAAVNFGLGMEDKTNAFYLFLGAYFIIALGFSLQQTAANPFAILLGDPAKGSHRLNFAGGVNSFGTTIGPLVISILLFGRASDAAASSGDTDISKINILYIVLVCLFLAAAGIFAITKMPKGTDDEHFENSSKATRSLIGIAAMFILITVGISQEKPLPFFIAGIIGILGILFYSQISARKSSGEGWGAMKYFSCVFLINQRLYIDVGGSVWEVRSPFDISSSAKNSRCENTETHLALAPRGWPEERPPSTRQKLDAVMRSPTHGSLAR